MKVWVLGILAAFALGCDPDHHQKCEWSLEPDPARIDKVGEGFVPACARNRIVNKQDCRLQTTMEFAKKLEGKRFKYANMKLKSYGIPRTIRSIDTCDE